MFTIILEPVLQRQRLLNNYQTYGVLYNWPAAFSGCPYGWYLPSYYEEYYDFIVSLSPTNIGGKLKTTGTIQSGDGLWESPNTGATNESGYSGLPGGYGFEDSTFRQKGFIGMWWLSTEFGSERAWPWSLSYNNGSPVNLMAHRKSWKKSVRCIHDEGYYGIHSPEQPNNPSPADGDVNQNLNINLSWSCSDPDDDLSFYEVYLGYEDSLFQVANNNFDTSYTPEYLINDTLYFWKIVAHDMKGNKTESPVWSFKTEKSWECGYSFIDERDGQEYNTVQIGTQCWMAKNLNFGTRIDGVVEMTNNGTTEKYCYENTESNCDVYGGLYQWDEMMNYTTTPGVQGICPDGWHMPTDAEWCTLELQVDPTITCGSTGWRGVDGGGKLKEAGTTHWSSPNTGATNSIGFSGLPGGYRYAYATFYTIGLNGLFWSSTEYSTTCAWYRNLIYNSANIYRDSYGYGKDYGFSVRCLRD